MKTEENKELVFLQMALKHHLSGLKLAEDCGRKAVHEEVKEICRRMRATHAEEIESFRSWLEAWHDVRPNEVLSERYQAMIRELDSLEGKEYEKLFLEHMTDHHAEMLTMLEDDCSEDFHEELFELCKKMHRTQSSEYDQMVIWLCEWYRVC